MNKLFELGQIVATPAAADALGDSLPTLIFRHMCGDFGDLDEEDTQMNKDAISTGNDRVFSAYHVNGEKYYVITEWDRSVTTVLFADEY